jgi:hypothetical protein
VTEVYRGRLGTSARKEGAVVVVGTKKREGKKTLKQKKTLQAQTSKRRIR